MVLIHEVHLTDEDRCKLHDVLKVGEHCARSITRGYILLLASQGKSDEEIAQTLEGGRATVQRVRKRYCQKGLEPSLFGVWKSFWTCINNPMTKPIRWYVSTNVLAN
jgi:demethoxyubiquinone hydroxylase (CLK1/Coq7/Cat5 family)